MEKARRTVHNGTMRCLIHILFISLCCVLGIAQNSEEAPLESEVLEQIVQLREEIRHHDELYYRQNQPEISDTQYDGLRRRLELLESDWPDLAREAGPGLPEIGNELHDQGQKSRHVLPMLSLNKSYSEDELIQFYDTLREVLGEERILLRVEPKLDGIAINAIYRKGILKKVLTRGDGLTGNDITASIRRTGQLPGKLKSMDEVPDLIELRGEAFIEYPNFEEINANRLASGESPYATPRNMVAGTMRMSDLNSAMERGVRVVVFTIGAWHSRNGIPHTEKKIRTFLKNWGIPLVQPSKAVSGLEELLKCVSWFVSNRENWLFPCDGIVVELENTRQREVLGYSSKGPKWAIAYKFPSPVAYTELVGINWQVGEKGTVTPIALLDPILLGERRVERASLYNARFLRDGNYRIGDTVKVELKGDAIPVIKGVVNSRNSTHSIVPDIPENCPECGNRLNSNPSYSRIVCPNKVHLNGF